MVFFGKKWFYSDNVVVFGKVVLFAKNGCIGTKAVVLGQKWLYSGKVVVFGKNGCICAEAVVFGQSGLIWAKVVVIYQK